MAFDFPTSPGVGQLFQPSGGATYQWTGTVWTVAAPASTTILTVDTAPTNPINGQLWWQTSTGLLFIWFNDGSSSQWVQLPVATTPVQILFGQCYLDSLSISDLRLMPCNGSQLWINGVNRIIPQAGVTLAATGVTVATQYIYAYWTGLAVALEFSTTAPTAASADANGWRYKIGDLTRTLVGVTYPQTAAQWPASIPTCTCSWFNPKPKHATSGVASPTTASTTAVELSTTLRVPFATLDFRGVHMSWSATCTVTLATADCYGSLGLDGTTAIVASIRTARVSATAGTAQLPMTIVHYEHCTEGGHYATPLGYSSASNTAGFASAYTEVMTLG